MIVCPWCGTNYLEFRSNCKNCGGPLPAAAERRVEGARAELLVPPPAPRSISDKYTWRLLAADGWAVTAFIFIFIGSIFMTVGGGLTLGIVTAIVGIPFLLLGILFAFGGAGVVMWRFQEVGKVVDVLRNGESTVGQISQIQVNTAVQVNGQNPVTIRYQFQVHGQEYEGAVHTLNRSEIPWQTGSPVSVLYLPGSPDRSAIYPHP